MVIQIETVAKQLLSFFVRLILRLFLWGELQEGNKVGMRMHSKDRLSCESWMCGGWVLLYLALRIDSLYVCRPG